jgi:2-oxoglutarate ferredoxin oxidoreductase subunit alpha
MTERVYMKGNEALAYGALKSKLNAYFAYPITPSTEIPETLAKEFGNEEYPDFKVFLQAASELEAVNMVLGAAAGGVRAMTATSSPGFSLKQEALSYAAGMELPLLVVNVNRGGPGLGNIAPEQSDYFQMTKGGGHGSYRLIVLAPNSVQEMASFPKIAFDLAFKYRNPACIAGDAFTGQLKEDIIFPTIRPTDYDVSDWAVTGAKGRERHVLNSMNLDPEVHTKHVTHLDEKYKTIQRNEVRYETYLTDDAEIVLAAYGITSRICKSVVNKLRHQGVKIGLFRPITLWPFPYEEVRKLTEHAKRFLVVELNTGQMVEDIRLGCEGRAGVGFFGKVGGLLPAEREIESKTAEETNWS